MGGEMNKTTAVEKMSQEQILLEILRSDSHEIYGLVVIGKGPDVENFCDSFPVLYYKKDAEIRIRDEEIAFQISSKEFTFKICKDEGNSLRKMLCLCHHMKIVNIKEGHGFRMEAPHP
ncbi:hypothetical protein A2996_00325 [Candidatus Campbellbacteria bacterium RIFCSPLOWO2_01_FULL_34_15]|uniref:Uncharacterized protein n=2 Tax=Candidatus Campbelliibacteriota TaxID=1752727 RepID=A0A1F5EMG1_9BACT|nr:MAG: hypothetical protein A2811_00475 [Candidatus Campbellbacteria bacterium RIFCSPHIGHO2_01_FULL_34_10]OGD68563.1 MAG: hypothetical protein A2996_00325 [Candidatus Campbellbacteria bacterium RIFCSPLOWO2_01_FULL_34_15]